MLNWFRISPVCVFVSLLLCLSYGAGTMAARGLVWPSRQPWEHIAVTPRGSSSLRGSQVESECCQFGCHALTTALSGSSSDRPINADAKPCAHTNLQSKAAGGKAEFLQPKTGSVAPPLCHPSGKRGAGLLSFLFEHAKTFPFISALVLFPNSWVSSAKRKLKYQTLLIMWRGLCFFPVDVQQAVLSRRKYLSRFENKANRIWLRTKRS